MKIQNHLHMMSTLLLLLFAALMLIAGGWVITELVYRLNAQLLELRLDGIIKEIESVQDILVRAGLDDVEKYNESAQNEVISEFRDYRFGETGMVMIIDADKIELLQGIFDLDFLVEMNRATGSLEYDYFGEPRYGVYQTFEPWEWTVSLSITKKEMFSFRSRYIRVVAVVTVIISIVSIAVAFWFSHRLTLSIRRILEGLKRYEDGDTDVRLRPRSMINEIVDLHTGFNSMTERINERTRDLVDSNEERLRILKALHDEELLHKEARISALQSQINPHFLYNTLECISSIALAYEATEIQEIAVSLSHMFKYAVRKDVMVKVREEITSVESYLKVQKIRFAEKIRAEVDIPDEILELKTMKFIIQPIVENSIYHGLEPKMGPGLISITGRRDEDIMEIIIADDGIGMDDALLKRVVDHLAGSAAKEDDHLDSRGIGLVNIHNRIVLSYGDDFGLVLRSEPGTGTTVVLRLPVFGAEKEGIRIVPQPGAS